MKRTVAVVMASLLAVAALPSQQPAVERYTFALTLPGAGKHVQGIATIEFASRPATDSLTLDLDAAMTVRDVGFGCGELPGDLRSESRFVRTGNLLKVPVPPSARGADTRCLRVSYDGEPADGLIIGTDSAGRWAAFGDNFPNRARYWLPTFDRPSAKAKVTWRITAPAGLEIVANGARVGIATASDGRTMTTWREDRPIPTYAMVIAAGPLVMHDLGKTACGLAEDGECVPQMVWTAPEQAKFMPGQFAHAGEIVDFFARTIGAFPYEKLAHLQTTTRYGGMENSSAIFYADQLFRRANGISDGLIAHETAHQWFGDAVTEREWAHAWLSEGFATFFAALWTQHARGGAAYRAELTQIRRQVIAAEVAGTRAVIDSIETDPNRLLNANTYQKGGFVLHMLRTQLGDSVFFGGLRAYFAEHKHGNAMTQDLQRALERSSGRELGWFFDQWLRRPGWAEVRISWQWNAATQRVTLDVTQGARFGAYRMPVAVDVTNADGTHSRVTVAVAASATQRVELPGVFAARPTALAFDPDVALLATFVAK